MGSFAASLLKTQVKMEMSFFNVDDGFLEAIARGYRGRILTKDDYQSLIQADTLDDLKMHLSSGDFDYGDFLEDLQSEYLDYISYGYMIENLCLLIKGSLKGDP